MSRSKQVFEFPQKFKQKSEERITVMQLIEESKRIYSANKFVFYAIADGIFVVLSKCKQGIADMLKKKNKIYIDPPTNS